MFENKTFRLIAWIVFAVAILIYITGLYIDVTCDAGKYATVAKEIFQNGNFINLTVHGEPYDQKPPMLFWLGAVGFAIGGISNFWFKLPVLILVFVSFYWAYRLGKSLYNKRVGFLAAIMLGFSVMYMLYSMDIHTDTVLQAFVTLSLWQFFEFIKTGKNRYWIVGFIAVGLAMLSKGPVGAAIPAFAVIGHLALKRNFRSLLDYRWYLGILLAFAVASPALIGLMNQFGWEGIRFFFWENNVGRVTGSYIQSTNDPIFYVHNLIHIFLPWSIMFFVAVFMEFKTLFKNKFKAHEYFTFTGIWIYFIIINLSRNQLPNYIFSIIPLVAILTAKWIDIALNENQHLLKIFSNIQRCIVILLWLGIFLIAFYLFKTSEVHVFILIFGGILLSLFVLLRAKNKLTKTVLLTLISFTCMMLLLNAHVFPYMFSFQATPKAARYFSESAGEGEKLYNYKYPQYELFFYSEPQAIQIKSDDEMKAIAGKKGNWIFTNEEGFKEIEKLGITPEFIQQYEHLALNRPAGFIIPSTRKQTLKPMYLIKY
ncbi:MAG: glycosyltransferase family 39 protein [Bacteroidales bacterium]|jgi:4-amino-4-deoxy-L-arabinose transferase-like glycosyltransferase|nr:glycosyltransferase family 39 protein [Bacteroidales bacterium]